MPSTPGPVTTPGGVPASGNVIYYACIDRMSAADRDAMGSANAQTKKIFAESASDPDSMQSTLATCKTSLASPRLPVS